MVTVNGGYTGEKGGAKELRLSVDTMNVNSGNVGVTTTGRW